MAKRGPDPEKTRETIRSSAIRLFQANGVHATSLADIAAAAQLSKGTLYYHYPAKDALVLEIAQEHFACITEAIFAWIDQVTELQGSSVRESLNALSAALLPSVEDMRLHLALLSESLREESALRAHTLLKQREWALMLELGALRLQGQGAKEFRVYSKLYLALLDGLYLHALLDEDMDYTLFHSLITGQTE